MRHFIKVFIICAFIMKMGTFHTASGAASFQQCADVWGVVSEYCEAPTTLRLAQVNSEVGIDPRLQLGALRKWIDSGGLLIALFGTPSDIDRWNIRKLPQWNKRVEQYTFDDYKRLLTGFVRLPLNVEATAALSSNMQSAIERNSTLTSTQKKLLKLILPEKTPEEMSESLGRSFLDGSCECDARLLEDRLAQLKQCTCWIGFCDSDLRRITPRILSVVDQIEGSNALCTLLLAHIERKNTSMFWPMKYPNPELRKALIRKLKEELAAEKYTGSDTFKCMGLFMFLGCWDEVDQLSILALEQSKSFSDYVLKRGVVSFQSNVIFPIIKTGRVICWLALKLGLVKN